MNLNADITNAVAGSASTVNVSAPGQIQDGIDAAATGGTVNVAAGTYAENVVVTKQLLLLGAQAGVDARGRVVGAPESGGRERRVAGERPGEWNSATPPTTPRSTASPVVGSLQRGRRRTLFADRRGVGNDNFQLRNN